MIPSFKDEKTSIELFKRQILIFPIGLIDVDWIGVHTKKVTYLKTDSEATKLPCLFLDIFIH